MGQQLHMHDESDSSSSSSNGGSDKEGAEEEASHSGSARSVASHSGSESDAAPAVMEAVYRSTPPAASKRSTAGAVVAAAPGSSLHSDYSSDEFEHSAHLADWQPQPTPATGAHRASAPAREAPRQMLHFSDSESQASLFSPSSALSDRENSRSLSRVPQF